MIRRNTPRIAMEGKRSQISTIGKVEIYVTVVNGEVWFVCLLHNRIQWKFYKSCRSTWACVDKKKMYTCQIYGGNVKQVGAHGVICIEFGRRKLSKRYLFWKTKQHSYIECKRRQPSSFSLRACVCRVYTAYMGNWGLYRRVHCGNLFGIMVIYRVCIGYVCGVYTWYYFKSKNDALRERLVGLVVL